jgi:hypothetical protein
VPPVPEAGLQPPGPPLPGPPLPGPPPIPEAGLQPPGPPEAGSAEQANTPPGPSLTLAGTDAAFEAIGAVTGQGAQSERRRLLGALLGRATDSERSFLIRLLAGDLGQGALAGIMTEAIARAAGVPADLVRRAHQLGGSLPEVAQAALGGPGGPDADRALAALRSFTLRVGRPLRPMLAAAAANMGAALARISPAAVEWKIDGIRIQVHKNDGEVTVFTRTLDDITARVPEIADAVLGIGAATAVLDGEAVALFPDGRPRPFQVTSGRAASHDGGGQAAGGPAADPVLLRPPAPRRHRPDRHAGQRAACAADPDPASRAGHPAHCHGGSGRRRGSSATPSRAATRESSSSRWTAGTRPAGAAASGSR